MFKKHLPYLLIIFVAIAALMLTNYIPGTSLSGWDNLQTELNPALAIKRSVFSVWEEYQSFGVLAGMGHAADLVRSIAIAVLSFVLPVTVVRYVYHFGMIAIGALGMYMLIERSQSHMSPHDREGIPEWKQHTRSMLGSLFYILCYGTVQIFAVPFEAFSTFLGFLPWLIWSFLRYVKPFAPHVGRPHNLAWFTGFGTLVLVNLLATPLAYVQTMFVVYMLVLGVLSVSLLVAQTHRLQSLTRIFIALVTIVTLNAFWLLPQVYFIASGGAETVQNAKINQLSTEDVVLQNREKGNIESFMTMTGFYSDLDDSQNQPLFGAWKLHYEKLPFYTLQLVLFVIFVYGLLKRSAYRLGFIGLGLVSLFAWLVPVPDIGLAGQIFRSPFTKFISVYALVAAYGFAHGVKLDFGERFVEIREQTQKILNIVLYLLIILAVSWPAFRGHYLARDMRVEIPQDYYDTIEYFNSVDPNARIALLPDYTFWGWFFTDWGYNGSGFLWYGIEQPIVSRTFDVWGSEGEAYYWEMKAAAEAEDVAAVERVLDKYAIDYIILDFNLRPVTSSIRALQYDRLVNLLEKSTRIQQFGSGSELALYRVERNVQSESFVSLLPDVPRVGPDVTFTPDDKAYEAFGTYRTSAQPDAYYPFRNLFTQTRQTDSDWTITETEDSIIVSTQLAIDPAEYTFDRPDNEEKAVLFAEGNERNFLLEPAYSIDDRTFTVTVPKQTLISVYPHSGVAYECGSGGSKEIFLGDGFTRLFSSEGSVPCYSYDLDVLGQNNGYLINLKTENLEGRRPFVSITDKTKGQAVFEERLQSDSTQFIIPPRFSYGQGYTLTFQNTSYDHLPSTNIIHGIEVYHFPYESLMSARFIHRNAETQERLNPFARDNQSMSPTSVNKRAYHAYTVDMTSEQLDASRYVMLEQAFHPGWHAYVVNTDWLSEKMPYIAGRQLTQHVHINGWAQGWTLPDSCVRGKDGCRIVMIFWPQYIQYFGFALLGVVIALGVFGFFEER